jgi:hypothetical protein
VLFRSVTQTVDIPESHRLTIDVPREVPAGRSVLTFTPSADMESEMDETKYLLSTPANREHLDRAINSEKLVAFDTMEQLEECVRERDAGKGAALLQAARERGAGLTASGKLAAAN